MAYENTIEELCSEAKISEDSQELVKTRITRWVEYEQLIAKQKLIITISVLLFTFIAVSILFLFSDFYYEPIKFVYVPVDTLWRNTFWHLLYSIVTYTFCFFFASGCFAVILIFFARFINVFLLDDSSEVEGFIAVLCLYTSYITFFIISLLHILNIVVFPF